WAARTGVFAGAGPVVRFGDKSSDGRSWTSSAASWRLRREGCFGPAGERGGCAGPDCFGVEARRRRRLRCGGLAQSRGARGGRTVVFRFSAREESGDCVREWRDSI